MRDTAFTRFQASAGPILAGPATYRRGELAYLLESVLERDDLGHADTDTVFEACVMSLLAGGWQPGHDSLFEAASEVFGWDEAPGRLHHFGAAGTMIEAALREHGAMAHQRDFAVRRQQQLFTWMRAGPDPAAATLRRDMPYVMQMQTNFPNLLAIMVDPAVIDLWHRVYLADGGPDLGHVPLAPGRAPIGNRGPERDRASVHRERAADAAVLLGIACIIAWIYSRMHVFF